MQCRGDWDADWLLLLSWLLELLQLLLRCMVVAIGLSLLFLFTLLHVLIEVARLAGVKIVAVRAHSDL